MDLSTSQGMQAKARGHLILVHSAPPRAVCRDYDLTTSDMMSLAMWMRRSELHGYPRTVIEVGRGTGAPEEGGYALVYEPSQDWASWGVARDGEELVVWHCGTGVDQGRFPTMQAALDSLPVVWRRAARTHDAGVGRALGGVPYTSM